VLDVLHEYACALEAPRAGGYALMTRVCAMRS
jgi:hypothetical protein